MYLPNPIICGIDNGNPDWYLLNDTSTCVSSKALHYMKLSVLFTRAEGWRAREKGWAAPDACSPSSHSWLDRDDVHSHQPLGVSWEKS